MKKDISKSTEAFAQISVNQEFCIWCPPEAIVCLNATPVRDIAS